MLESFLAFCEAHNLHATALYHAVYCGKWVFSMAGIKNGQWHPYTIAIPDYTWDSFKQCLDENLIDMVIKEFELEKDGTPTMKTLFRFCRENNLDIMAFNDDLRDEKVYKISGCKDGKPHDFIISIPCAQFMKMGWEELDTSCINSIINEFGLSKEEKPQIKEIKYKIIASDFDGTLCENKWPEIGKPNKEVIGYLKKQRASGDVRLILWTCRTGKLLKEAVDWCKELGLEFDTVNENIPENAKEFGADSRKVFAHEYIDDHNSTRFQLPYVTTLT